MRFGPKSTSTLLIWDGAGSRHHAAAPSCRVSAGGDAQEWVPRPGGTWPEIAAAGGLPGLGAPPGADAPGATGRMLQEMLAAQLHAHAHAPPRLAAAGFPGLPLDGRHR